MAIYRIKRFAELDGESHTLRNTILGVGATAAALYAGKKGMLGTSLQKGINKGWAKTGKAIGSNSMVSSGTKGYAEGATRELYNNMVAKAGNNANAKAALGNALNYEEFANSSMGQKFMQNNTNAFTNKLNNKIAVKENGNTVLKDRMTQEQIDAAVSAKKALTPNTPAENTPAAPVNPPKPRMKYSSEGMGLNSNGLQMFRGSDGNIYTKGSNGRYKLYNTHADLLTIDYSSHEEEPIKLFTKFRSKY